MQKMKMIAILFASLFVLSSLTGCTQSTPTPTPPAEPAPYDGSQFPEWFENEATWRTVLSAAFKEGEEYAPTDEEIARIMRMASLTPTSGGMTDYMWVIVRDVDQQRDVVGEKNAHSGTVMAMLFADRLFSPEESIHNHEQQIDRGYVTSGMAGGYLNIAAVSQGFGTHWYLTTEYTKPGWEETRSQSAEETYLGGKDYRYTFGNPTYRNRDYPRDENDAAEAYGNLKFVMAVIIGTVDETAETSVTKNNYPENWVMAK
jgi:nitroreductase/predicted small lipoprotein YifL